MKTKTIKVNTAEDISKLVDLAGHVEGDISITTDNNAKYDASSILGLFSVPIGSSMAVEYPADADAFDEFLNTLALNCAGNGY